ncbi:MAG: hypothetical protein IJ896_13475 [Fibrobacter sp.]|nr:hypothetical protein [Fibrobacter sp.]
MKFPIIALFCLCFAVSAFAAKYSADTRSGFLTSCLSGADKAVCECVLQKLESKYSESAFKKIEAQMLMGQDVSTYVDFIVTASKKCSAGRSAGAASGSLVAAVTPAKPASSSAQPAPKSAETTPAPAKISATDMMLLQMLLNNKAFKDSFVVECTKEGDKFLGATQSKKSCQCAYDHMLQNDSLLYMLMHSMNANGEVTDFEKLSYRLILPCLPAQFTPEMEAFLQNACLESVRAGSKTRCACAVKEIKKSYSIQELLQDILLDQESFKIKLIRKVGKCVAL